MAGHSKWSNIKHRKGRQDAARGKLFTRLIREVTVASRLGGSDSSSNPRLRAAVESALSANMPKDTIDRAIKRGSGSGDENNLEEVRYEGYGPGGAAVIVDCLTDNRNRTVAEVRHAFTKNNGKLGTDGSVSYLFRKIGVLVFPDTISEVSLLEEAIEAGAQDVVSDNDGTFDVITSPEDFLGVKDHLVSSELIPEVAEITFKADIEIKIDRPISDKLLCLLEQLDDLQDVQKVTTNAVFLN